MGEHGGTHLGKVKLTLTEQEQFIKSSFRLDSPFHFNVNGWTVDQIPPNKLIDVPAVLIDVEKSVNELERPYEFMLNVDHIVAYEKSHGIIPLGSVVLIHTGWSKYWPNKVKYLGWDNSTSEGILNFPGEIFYHFHCLLYLLNPCNYFQFL